MSNDMSKNKKKIIIPIVFVLLLVIATVGVTYAFFNYTRTGQANTVSTGTINFTSSQSGTFNLTNVFPIATGDVLTDNTNSSEVVITVTGDTTYTNGIEYLVTLEDVNIRTNTYKKVPVGIIVTPEKTGELGTSDNAYFTNRGGSTSIYKSFIGQSDVIEDGQYVLVGYIRPGQAEVNGTIGIRAFIDKDSIAITDTPEENVEWQNGRMVLSTSEWNSLQTNGISFKVRVVANEGVWVGEPTSRNDLKNFTTANSLTSAQKSAITEINFIRMSEEMINTHSDLIDLTNTSGSGVVKGWIENNKLYIASPGETYFPVDSSNLFYGFSNITNINFNNINTSDVEIMGEERKGGMFEGCSNLTSIDLSSWDTSNVTDMSQLFYGSSFVTLDLTSWDTSSVTKMSGMFNGCSSLINIDLSSFDTSNVTTMEAMFYGCSALISVDLSGLGSNTLNKIDGIFNNCTALTTINMSNFNFGTVSRLAYLFSGISNGTNSNIKNIDLSYSNMSNVTELMGSIFNNLINIETVNLSNANTSSVTTMASLFQNCSHLVSVNLSNIDTSHVTSFASMFDGCSSLTSLDLSSFDMSASTGANGKNIYNMFANCSLLEKIYVSNLWNVSTQPDGMPIFTGCTSLVGGNGTVFDSSKVDKTMAVIDTPSTPGYLTLKQS